MSYIILTYSKTSLCASQKLEHFQARHYNGTDLVERLAAFVLHFVVIMKTQNDG